VALSALETVMAAALKTRTTYPPVIYSNITLATDTTLPAQAQRDMDAPDLGYHYDPLDYLVNGVSLSATLTLGQGVAVGVMGDYGLNLQSGGHVNGTGTPTTLNPLCFYGNVQETIPVAGDAAVLRMDGTPNSTLSFRFTDLALRPGTMVSPVLHLPSGSASGTLALRDCQLRGCKLALAPTGSVSTLTVGLTNNFVEWSDLNFTRGSDVPLTVFLYNNLFRSNSFNLSYTNGGSNPTWRIRDNLFYMTSQTFSPWSSNAIVSYNGFTSGTGNSLGGSNSFTVTADFQSGPLGGYYYPTNGGGLSTLINADTNRTPADAGLYHFTVKTAANTKEGADTPAYVDIGYHYAAVNASNQPVDTDGDGVPDYLEDVDGNGSLDSGETDWQTYNSANGLSAGNALKVFTPLK
jgi:hypothetical protein